LDPAIRNKLATQRYHEQSASNFKLAFVVLSVRRTWMVSGDWCHQHTDGITIKNSRIHRGACCIDWVKLCLQEAHVG